MATLYGYAIEKNIDTGEQLSNEMLYHVENNSITLTMFNNKQPISLYRRVVDGSIETQYCWNNRQAENINGLINDIIIASYKTKLLKNGSVPKKSKIQVASSVSPYGNLLTYTGKIRAYSFEYTIIAMNKLPISLRITGDDSSIFYLEITNDAQLNAFTGQLLNSIQLVQIDSRDLNKQYLDETNTVEISEEQELMERKVRSIEEIALSKDLTWLKSKNYYIVNDEDTAEQIFTALEGYDGLISYDVETSGLNINMYCEIGSPWKRQLEEYNSSVPADQRIKADSLTGFSFCITPNIAYYFPCKHRKFKNLYEDKNSDTVQKTCNNIKARYTVGDLHESTSYIAGYIRETAIEDWGCDVILMERVRDILEQHKILAHHGSFEWETGWCYHIDTNLTEDTMILHQLAFKWKNVRTHSGEPSNLKYLSKNILMVNQLSLDDFFADAIDEDKASAGEVRSVSATSKKKKKKKKTVIDFSYMDYEGTRCYAPADVDLTLQLWNKFKVEMMKEFPDLEYLYGIEIVLACAIGYAEFYGLHINETKINNAKYKSLFKMANKEHQIRSINSLVSEEEQAAYDNLMQINLDDLDMMNADNQKLVDDALEKLSNIIANQGNLNLGSPGQVAELLYTKYDWQPDEDGKKSMGKKVIKQYENLTNADGTPKYPEVLLYRDWKDESTLITKFFDKLQDFMYPGGNMFSSFGQIACATGRMSSKKPNFQQLPKSITKIIEPRANSVFLDCDYSQIEYRVLVALAKQTNLIDAFNDPDMDYHQKMASLMFDVPYALVPGSLRKQAKSFNFGIPYGMGLTSLAIQLHGNKNKDSVDDAAEKYELYFKDQPKVRLFFDRVKEQARHNEYSKTYFGRRRYYKFTDETGNVNQRLVGSALRQAGNAVIQGTARDIFGIAAARAFTAIRKNNLLGKVRMVNFIHDEILYEIDSDLNTVAIVGLVLEAMQLNIPSYPPLYVGGGIGNAWASAKGEMNEIHPMLGRQLIEEYHRNELPAELDGTPSGIYKYFESRVYNFRKQKVASYIANTELELRQGGMFNAVDPAIGKLLQLQFEGGVEARVKEQIKQYKHSCEEQGREPNSNTLDKMNLSIIPLRMEQFIEDFPEDVKEQLVKLGFEFNENSDLHNMFIFDSLKNAYGLVTESDEEDKAYEDEADDEGILDDLSDYEFALIDDNDKQYGVSVIDIAKHFGMAVMPSRGKCCVYIGNKTKRQIDALAVLFDRHQCNGDDADAMEVELIRADNYVLRPGLYVNGITQTSVLNVLV